MTYIKGKTGLLLPKKTEEKTSNSTINAGSIEQWRDQLSLSDLPASAKALYLIIQETHCASLSFAERYEILSLLAPSVSYICQSLDNYYAKEEVLTENQRDIADLVNAVNFEMLNGYKLVIEAAYKPFFPNKKVLLPSLQNAMNYCTKILFNSYEQHRSPPKGTWLELHRLFVFSQTKGFSNKTLENATFKTLADIYKHCLLLSLCNPNRLRKEQIIELSYALRSWAPLLELREETNEDTPLFVVDLTNDAPPCYRDLYFLTFEEGYYLNLKNVNKRLQNLLWRTPNAGSFMPQELSLQKSFIESLLQSWQVLKEKAYEREKTHSTISVSLGIASSHWFMSNQDNPMDQNLYVCDLINKSEAGICLKWPKEIPPNLQNGEIIGIQNEIENQKIGSIGIIRWLRTEENQSLYVGIEYLSIKALAVNIHLYQATSLYTIPTLILPLDPEVNKPDRLIAPPFLFKCGNEIEVEFNGKTYPISLQKVRSASASYQEFEIQYLDEVLPFPYQLAENSKVSLLSSDKNKI